jgi:HEAT repeat protein
MISAVALLSLFFAPFDSTASAPFGASAWLAASTPLGTSQDKQDPTPEALLEQLRTEDAAERRRIQSELVRRGAAAVPAMVRALESVSPRPEEEVARLFQKLASTSWKERAEATAALVRLGRSAVPLLEARIAGADPEAAWRMRSAVAEIKEKAGQDEQLEEARAAAVCDALGQSGDGRAAAALLKVLSSDGPEKRLQLKLRAAQALGLLRGAMSGSQPEEAADRVLQVLERIPGPLEKAMLLKTLGRIGSPAAVRPLSALMADRSEKNVHLKRSCAAALAAIGHPRGVRAVVDALGADDVYVRQGAEAALEELAGKDFGYDPLLSLEQNKAAISKVQAWAAAKFGKDWEK